MVSPAPSEPSQTKQERTFEMSGKHAASVPRVRFASAAVIGIACFVGLMVSLPALFWLAGNTGVFIWVGAFFALAGWAVWHAHSHDVKCRSAMPPTPQSADPVQILRTIFTGEKQSWVLFSHGTFVVLTDPQSDVSAEAVALLRRHGSVTVGSEQGDFGAQQLVRFPGWIVTCHRPEIATYVGSGELGGKPETALSVGLFGRHKRGLDAAALEVIHVEDKRQRGGSAASSSE